VREKSHFENILGKFFHELSQVTSQKWIDLYESSFGHTAHAKVPAYEIEYGEEHSHRQPQELSDIASFYNAFGLKASDRLRERVDHVSVECEFMFFLLYKTAYALACDGEEKAAVCEQACRAFLSNHLSRWLPAFARRLARMTDHALMRSVAELATAWMSEECRLLEIKIGDEELGIRPVQEKEEAGCVSCLEATRKVPDQGGCHGA
jgi:TorA maturation chaperone TorD